MIFYEKFSFFLGFMILIYFFSMAFGESATEKLLLLILLGMILQNVDTFKKLVNEEGSKK